ncbi:TonB-dependent receptor [Bernardetia sp.]|uniref:TonB-dependent receptor n=1 Tax=Bernardetia sp. TaxID=1937974 RepID=UPI0025C03D84|nr:TonB-dependent receptor [Bernardetia sp.]
MKKAFLFLLLCIPFASLAQTDSTLYQLSIDELLEPEENLLTGKVSSASKIEQRVLDAPSIVKVITKERINKYGWVSLNDVLYRQAGFTPSQDYDRRTVSSRGVFEGWNNNHLLMLIDGVPYNDNLYGTAYTSEVTPLVFSKSIELIRGPVSALYGANAMNGAIGLNTISPSDFRQNGMAQIRLGSNNTQIYDAVVGGEGDLVSAVIAFNSFSTSGNEYLSYDDSERTDDSGNFLMQKINDTRNSYYLFGKLEGRGKLAGFELQYHQHAWESETGHGWLFFIPDQPEAIKENRKMLSLRYTSGHLNKKLVQEYVIRYQNHGLDWNMRYYPNGALDNFYPLGVSEYLNTSAEDVFGRMQYKYSLGNESVLLAGIEGNLFYYDGDNAHTSNIDLNSDFAPFPDNDPRPMNAWLEFVESKPLLNLALFAQYTSPRLLNNILQATITLRYDNQFFNYTDVYSAERNEENKSFEQFSPRIGLVFNVMPTFTIKALAGRAFRTPTPTEMFGANTYSLASNINELSAESITTFELVGEWQTSKKTIMRLNTFYTNFEDIIAYSVANANLSTNLYSLANFGVEYEIESSLSSEFQITGNYSFVQRLSETIRDTTITESPENLTWYPAHSLNLGMIYEKNKCMGSLMVHAQSEVNRRSSDINDRTKDFRSENVSAWATIDTKFAYRFTPYLELGLLVRNLTNQENFLIKNNAYRFDYRMNQRNFLINLKYDF